MEHQTGKEDDFLTVDIGCLNPESLHATLVSTTGSHCEVWRTSKRQRDEEESSLYLEFVIKYPRSKHSNAEIRLLSRHYRMLKSALDDVIPDALFFITEIDDQPNVCILARAVNIWFNIANPQNRDEAISLLREHPRARNQLLRFVNAATQWRNSDERRLIDLFGVDNLVMDNNREIRYLDSFFVFFFEDMLDQLGEHDVDLDNRIILSLERLDYLQSTLNEAMRGKG
jgi:hypothetical protein